MRSSLLVCLILTGAGLGRSDAAEPAPPPADAPTVVVTQADESRFPTIAVHFELRRPDGSAVLDAPRAAFRVAEGGRDRPIVEFDAPVEVRKQPSTVVLVLDRSGSMREGDRIGGLKRAVASFLEAMPDGSRVAVVAFGSDVALACPFTADRDRVRSAVDELVADGGTRYFDAVAAALGLLAEESGRRAIVAMTDGRDTESRLADLPGVVAAARRANLPVHTLAFGQLDGATLALRELAASTRGQSFDAADAGQLRTIFEEIARRLGSTYRLTYATDRRVPDGTLRPIEVFYANARQAGQAAVFIRGMVVPARGWPGLFLALLVGLIALAAGPAALRGRARARRPAPPVAPR